MILGKMWILHFCEHERKGFPHFDLTIMVLICQSSSHRVFGILRGLWSQPSATVRNRPQPFVRTPYGRAYGKFCRGGHFWRFPMRRCFVSRGRRGTSWHSDVFCNVSKVVLCGRRNTFATFSEDVLHFSSQAQHFGRVRRSTLDVSYCVLFQNRIGRAASSGDKVQISWQPWHFVTCAENWR